MSPTVGIGAPVLALAIGGLAVAIAVLNRGLETERFLALRRQQALSSQAAAELERSWENERRRLEESARKRQQDEAARKAREAAEEDAVR